MACIIEERDGEGGGGGQRRRGWGAEGSGPFALLLLPPNVCPGLTRPMSHTQIWTAIFGSLEMCSQAFQKCLEKKDSKDFFWYQKISSDLCSCPHTSGHGPRGLESVKVVNSSVVGYDGEEINSWRLSYNDRCVQTFAQHSTMKNNNKLERSTRVSHSVNSTYTQYKRDQQHAHC